FSVLAFITVSATTEIYTLSLHDALPISKAYKLLPMQLVGNLDLLAKYAFGKSAAKRVELYKKYLSVNDSHYLTWAIKNMVCWNQDRKSTRLNSSHVKISYAVFCLKKKRS